jgi:hypothetical protein
MDYIKFDNFDEYKSSQIATHLRKIGLLWFCGLTATPIKNTAEQLLRKHRPTIVCMGSRNGLEPRFFHESGFLRALGTDIAPTANCFPWMMNHDFHEMKPPYLRSFDVLYSNSFDHAYDINRFLLAGRSFLDDASLIILDYSPKDNSSLGPSSPASKSADCLAIGMDELIERIYAVIGYRLVGHAFADPRISLVWKHYKDLKHLFFASPKVFDHLKRASYELFEDKNFLCVKDNKDIEQYLEKLHKYTAEHLAYIDNSFMDG